MEHTRMERVDEDQSRDKMEHTTMERVVDNFQRRRWRQTSKCDHIRGTSTAMGWTGI